MTAADVPLAIALLVGLMAGLAIAQLRRVPSRIMIEPLDPADQQDDDTRPTLVPFRTTREGGRSLARTDPDQTPEERDQLDALLAEFDRRKR